MERTFPGLKLFIPPHQPVDEMSVKRRPKRATASRHKGNELVQIMLTHLRSGGDARLRKVRRLRAAIKVGCYENDLKLQVALDRMIRDVEWR